jgi:outer membrane protein TolC
MCYDGQVMKVRNLIAGLAGLACLGVMPAYAQQGGSAAPAAMATPLPLSARSPEAVGAQQSAAPAGSSVDVIQSSIQVQAPYTGSVPDKSVVPGTASIPVSLADAVRRGLRFNLGQISAESSLRQASAQKESAFSALLPQLSASAGETGAKIDLQAEGLSASTLSAFGPLAAAFPTVVGPFHYYTLQANLQASLFNLTSLYNFRAASAGADAAQLDAQNARELVVLAVTGNYLQVLASIAGVEAQVDQVRYAQATYDRAKAQFDAGNKAQIDATRSLVQLQTEQQRLRSERGDLQKQKYALARLLGLPLTADLLLTSELNDSAEMPMEAEAAVHAAIAHRQDLKAAEAQVRAAESARKAASSERLPTASVQGYYGLQGINPDSGRGVFDASASVNVPIFEGGRLKADREQASAVLDQHRAELEDQRGQVELEVRDAYTDLQVAIDQVQVAASNRQLALETLQQSQDRYSAGAADSVEVVQSQQTLGSAERDYVSAIYAQNLARISLARAMGEAENDIITLLKDK